MLTDIRLLSHQLAKPRFRSPKELVAWMGAVQAQEYTMAKWAVGTRLKSSSLQVVDDAACKGGNPAVPIYYDRPGISSQQRLSARCCNCREVVYGQPSILMQEVGRWR